MNNQTKVQLLFCCVTHSLLLLSNQKTLCQCCIFCPLQNQDEFLPLSKPIVKSHSLGAVWFKTLRYVVYGTPKAPNQVKSLIASSNVSSEAEMRKVGFAIVLIYPHTVLIRGQKGLFTLASLRRFTQILDILMLIVCIFTRFLC